MFSFLRLCILLVVTFITVLWLVCFIFILLGARLVLFFNSCLEICISLLVKVGLACCVPIAGIGLSIGFVTIVIVCFALFICFVACSEFAFCFIILGIVLLRLVVITVIGSVLLRLVVITVIIIRLIVCCGFSFCVIITGIVFIRLAVVTVTGTTLCGLVVIAITCITLLVITVTGITLCGLVGIATTGITLLGVITSTTLCGLVFTAAVGIILRGLAVITIVHTSSCWLLISIIWW